MEKNQFSLATWNWPRVVLVLAKLRNLLCKNLFL